MSFKPSRMLVWGVVGAFVLMVGYLCFRSLKSPLWPAEHRVQAGRSLDTALKDLEQKLAAERKRANAAETDLGDLLQAVQKAKPDGKAQNATSTAATQREITERLTKADALIASGNYADALIAYRAIMNEYGFVGPNNISFQRILSKFGRFAEIYEPAKIELRSLRDGLAEKVASGEKDGKSAMNIALINNVLGDTAGTVALFKDLPDGDPRRSSIAAVSADALVGAGMYSELEASRPIGAMMSDLEVGIRHLGQPGFESGPQARAKIVDRSVKDIEVLVGAGKDEDANLMTQKLLRFDNSQATKDLIKSHVERGFQNRKGGGNG